MFEEQVPNKILWITIKSALRKDISTRKIKNPKIRLRAIENIEELLRNHFYEIYKNPMDLLKQDRNEFKRKLGQYKPSGSLSGAEESIINNIYEYLKANVTDDEQGNDPNNEEESAENNPAEAEPLEHIASEQILSFNTFEKELGILKDLFSEDYVSNKLDRIEEIYYTSEDLWEEQLISLPEGGIKYLLIAEAPPWSSEGEVTYVYNPKSEPRTLLKALCNAFLGEPMYKEIGTEETLKRLAALGLIMIDSLPFAMDYSSKRNSAKYSKLVAHAVNSYMLKKINRDDLKWSNELKIAFAFKRNGLAIINALEDGLLIKKLNKSLNLSEHLIVANAAGYPDAKKLKEIFGL